MATNDKDPLGILTPQAAATSQPEVQDDPLGILPRPSSGPTRRGGPAAEMPVDLRDPLGILGGVGGTAEAPPEYQHHVVQSGHPTWGQTGRHIASGALETGTALAAGALKFPALMAHMADKAGYYATSWLPWAKDTYQGTATGLDNVAEDVAKFGHDIYRKNALPIEQQHFFNTTLPIGMAQMASVAGAGLLGGPAAAYATGMAQQGGYNLAETGEFEMTPDDRLLSYGLNVLLGTTEAIPILQSLKRIPGGEALSGSFGRALLRNKKVMGFTQVTRDVALQALEEGIQELGQTFGENVIAADIVGYDPDRPLNDQIWQAAGEGAALGSIFELLMKGVYRKPRARHLLDIQSQLDREAADPDNPYTVGGQLYPFSPEFQDAYARLADIEARYRPQGVYEEPSGFATIEEAAQPVKGDWNQQLEGFMPKDPARPNPGWILDMRDVSGTGYVLENHDTDADLNDRYFYTAVYKPDGADAKTLNGFFSSAEEAGKALRQYAKWSELGRELGYQGEKEGYRREIAPSMYWTKQLFNMEVKQPDGTMSLEPGLAYTMNGFLNARNFTDPDLAREPPLEIRDQEDAVSVLWTPEDLAKKGEYEFQGWILNPMTGELQAVPLPRELANFQTNDSAEVTNRVEELQARLQMQLATIHGAYAPFAPTREGMAPEGSNPAISDLVNDPLVQKMIAAFNEGGQERVPSQETAGPWTLDTTDTGRHRYEHALDSIRDDNGRETSTPNGKTRFVNLRDYIEGPLKNQDPILGLGKYEIAYKQNKSSNQARAAYEISLRLKKISSGLIEYYNRLMKGENHKLVVVWQRLSSDTNGSAITYYPYRDGQPSISVIRMNQDVLEKAMQKFILPDKNGRWKPTKEDRNWIYNKIIAQVSNTLVHELGHNLLYAKLTRAINKLILDGREGRGPLGKDQATLASITNAVARDYVKWVGYQIMNGQGAYWSSMPTKLTSEGNQALGEQFWVRHPNQNLEEIGADLEYRAYILNPDEFHAQAMAEVILNNPDLIPPWMDKAWKQVVEEVGGTVEQVKAAYPQLKQYMGLPESMTDFVRWLSLKGKLEWEAENAARHYKSREAFFIKLAKEFRDKGLEEASVWARNFFNSLHTDLDRFNWFQKTFWNILQITKDNPHIQPLQDYTRTAQYWQQYKINHIEMAEGIAKAIRALGKDQSNRLAKLLLDEDRAQEYLEAKDIKTYGLNRQALQLREEIYAYYSRVLGEMQSELMSFYKQKYADNPMERDAKIKEVVDQFAAMEARPYFPHMRFGRYVVGIRNKEGKLVNYQHAESWHEAKLLERRAKAEVLSLGEGHTMYTSKVEDVAMSLEGMPTPILEVLRNEMPGVTNEQKQFIDELIERNIPVRGFAQRMMKRRGVEGYSEDLIRVFSAYAWTASSHLARIKFHGPMAQAVRDLKAEAHAITYMNEGAAGPRAELANYLARHMDYLLNPMNEFPMIRSVVFTWFLGFNIKSAVVNLTQVPLFTYPYLAARYGEVAAVKGLMKAQKDAVNYFRDPNKVDPEVKAFLDWGKKAGFIDQSLAAEIAISASEGSMTRNYGIPSSQRIYYNVAHWAAMPFHAAEKMNRLTTGIAAFQMARAAGATEAQARLRAQAAVQATQFENMRWNRPYFMQGKRGVFFIFANYLQNALHFVMGGDVGATRAMLMFALLAGFTGLPFADDALDLLSGVMTLLKGKFGMKDPYTDLRRDLYQYIEKLGLDPELVLNGIARDSFGYNWLASKVGLPAAPRLDMSGSLAMGNILPGTEALRYAASGTLSSRELAARLIEEAGGPFTSASSDVLGAVSTDNPDRWKRVELALPAALRQMSKAARYAVRGEERQTGGVPIVEFDTADPITRVELMLQAIGFTPTDLSEGYDEARAVKDAVVYYQTFYRETLRQYARAVYEKNREAQADAWKAIERHNRMVPFPEMKIDAKAINRSVDEYYRVRILADQDIERQKKYFRFSRDVRSDVTQEEGGENP